MADDRKARLEAAMGAGDYALVAAIAAELSGGEPAATKPAAKRKLPKAKAAGKPKKGAKPASPKGELDREALDSIEFSKKMASKGPKAYREPYRSVKVTCARCGEEEEVHPDVAPKPAAAGETSSYICARCRRGSRRG